jgi:hypothetical protein
MSGMISLKKTNASSPWESKTSKPTKVGSVRTSDHDDASNFSGITG